jgi:predicted ATP-grasp superfamily ATP-dependent carboligase
MSEPEPLIIVGASTRAAAQSAARAGFASWCVDQFGDTDLRECAQFVRVVSDWPDGVPAALAEAPNVPLIYTGALENSPELIDELATRFPLAGNGSHVLRLVRSPFRIQELLRDAGLPAVEVRSRLTSDDLNTRWLAKPLSSAAGFHIHEAKHETPASAGLVFQQFVAGNSVSALFVASGPSVYLLGMCHQLQGEPDAGALGYLHCGSIGPLGAADVFPGCFALAEQIGQTLAADAGLVGLFGVDFILDQNRATLSTLEVNPRWPASAELYERAYGWPLMRWHVESSISSPSQPAWSTAIHGRAIKCDEQQTGSMWGRIIVYAPHPTRVDSLPSLVATLTDSCLDIADIPAEGSTVNTGHPVCTLLARAPGVDECRDKLCRAARQLRKRLPRCKTAKDRPKNYCQH